MRSAISVRRAIHLDFDLAIGDSALDVQDAINREIRPPSRRIFTTTEGPMFLFFSNRLGCLGSIVVSVLATLVLLYLFGVC